MIEQLAEMPTYEAYKDSGVEWLGEIPAHWHLTRLGTRFEERRRKVSDKDFPPLSVTKNGILPQLDTAAKTNDGDNRKLVKKGDFVINSRSDRKGSSGVCDRDGSVSLINIVLTPNGIDSQYCNFLLKSYAFIEEFYRMGHGIVADLWTTRYDEMKAVILGIPPLPEQTTIAAFLGRKTAQIDQAVAIKEQQIALLKERKQILIQNAVTRGLDPNVPMRHSGVEWIGEIPAHWNLKRLKYILNERNERSKTGVEPLFMVSQAHGLVVRSEFHEKAEVAQSNVDNKIVYKNDLVFNKLKAHLGVFFKSNIEFKGLVSPDYAVYHSSGLIDDLKYLEHLFRHPAYIGQFIIRATGIVEGLIRLYTGDLFQISIPVPPKHEQNAILGHIETQSAKIELAIAIQQQQIDKLKEYKATLIDSAVTGKIRVPEIAA
jgi:type I restriction enzyme S subunit